MSNLNGFKDRIQSVASVLATAALSASFPGAAILLNPTLRKKVTNDLFNAQATKAAGYFKAIKNELAQPDVQSIPLNHPVKKAASEATAETSADTSDSFAEAVEPAVDHTEKATTNFYKAMGEYDSAVEEVMSVESELHTLADDYQQKNEANPIDNLEQETTAKYEPLEAAQLNNMKAAEAAAKKLDSATNKLSGALNATEKLIDNNLPAKLSPNLSRAQLAGLHTISKNFNGLKSTLSLDLARGRGAKELVDGLKSASSIKLGISSITGNKASKKEESNKKPEENASESMEKGNRARKNLSMKLRPKGA